MAIIIRLLRVRLSAPPQQLAAYIHSCGVCLNEPKQMIAQPLIEDYNDRRNYYGPFSMQKTGICYIEILILRKKGPGTRRA